MADLSIPEDEKFRTAAPGCFFKEQARAPALHFQEFFTVLKIRLTAYSSQLTAYSLMTS
jgi:hypothetical protein